MPQRKKVPGLEDLCIDSIVRNIVFHGEMFKRNASVHNSYKILQRLYSDDLLKRLFILLLRESEQENLKELKDVMFIPFDIMQREPDCSRYSPCLELFFNEYTEAILPSSHVAVKYHMSESALSVIASKCTNLKKINSTFHCFMQGNLYRTMSTFQNLRQVDLMYRRDYNVLKTILETCPLIQHLSADLFDTDLCFLSLCKHYSFNQEEFIFCPENGECSNAGKHLEHLHVYVSKTTVNGAGIACALQHLPLLKSFQSFPRTFKVIFPRNSVPDVAKGILTLRNASIHKRKELFTLKLTVLGLQNDLNLGRLHDVLMTCPYLETVELNARLLQIFTLGSLNNLKELCLWPVTKSTLQSQELNQFLSAEGCQLESIDFAFAFALDIVSLNEFLHSCFSIKRLSFKHVYITERSISNIINMPSCIGKLEDIFLGVFTNLLPPPPSSYLGGYFCNLLSNAKSVRCLTLASTFAKQEFLFALDKTDFPSLQELVLYSESSEDFPYDRVLEASKSLRKIRFLDQPNISSEANCMHLDLDNNFEVEFETDLQQMR